eukprot:TRINITY_DN660_c0_g1_i2.p1 TRINITY_DN660_c0_g1~~TRINITY_DN660_c0_g1_i2.p1  ORF type:complete len:461 (-),score=25.28 TRINITY_DN660_c0_g1_i2:17-1399(-)
MSTYSDIMIQESTLGQRAIIYIVGTIMAMDFMIVLTSISAYWEALGGSIKLFGLIFSLYDIAQFCVEPFLGMLVDRWNYRSVYFITVLLNTIGNILYGIAFSFRHHRPLSIALIILGRCIAGIGSGNLALGFGYIALTVPQEKRTGSFAIYRLFNTLGRFLGPFIGAFLFYVPRFNIGGLELNAFTMPAWVMFIVNIVLFIPLIFLKEPHRHDSGDQKIGLFSAIWRLGYRGVMANLLYFIAIFAFWSWFPLLIVYAVIDYHFQISNGGYYALAYAPVGWGFGVGVLILRYLKKWISDYLLLCFSPILMIVGWFLFISFTPHQAHHKAEYFIGVILITLGFSTVAAVFPSYYSKLVEKYSLTHLMTTFMALMATVASLGRGLGPLWAPVALEISYTNKTCCDFSAIRPVADCCKLSNQNIVYIVSIVLSVLLTVGDFIFLRGSDRQKERDDHTYLVNSVQ